MTLSIVATLYQSAPHLQEFYNRAKEAARGLAGEDHEIILVNDGSPDASLQMALDLADTDDRLVVIDLSRNFGHHKAMMTGLAHAKGDLVFLIDSDLEEDPAWMLDFAKRLKSENVDVVYGVQAKRKGDSFERLSGHIFYALFNRLTNMQLPENFVTARLMSRRYVEALVRHDEREVFMAGLWQITGFEQRPIVVDKLSSSKTTYTLGRKLSLLVNSVTSFSNAPLVYIFYVGVFISFVAACSAIFLLVQWLLFTKPLNGWTSVMASIWLLGGMIISFIGVVGIYLSKIYSETKRRPYTIIRRIYAKQSK